MGALEGRCSPYDPDKYPHSPLVEPRIVDAQGGIHSPYTGTWFNNIKRTDIEHTVWVLMDDTTEDISDDFTGNTNGHLPVCSEHTGGYTGAENLAFQTEVKGLRELVDCTAKD